jgi:adenosine deaminase
VAFNIESVVNRDSEIWKTLWSWPKIELHRHLEGSIRMPTLIEVAHDFDIPLPAYDVDALRPHVQVTDEDEASASVFLSKFNVLRQFYCSMDIIQRITREAVEDAARDNVRYMELRFTPHALARQNSYTYEEVIALVCGEATRTAEQHHITVRLIVSVNRHESVEIADQVLDAALATQDCALVGIDLAGQEEGYSARPFKALFDRAQAAGLHLTVHAGEWQGAENVREAIEVLGAERIGHGVRCVEDSQVIQLVRERGITLEVCPTSNMQSGVVASLDQHPLIDLSYLGVNTTINTDDPALSGISLTDELVLAHVGLGIPLDKIRHNILNAARAAFLPDDERVKLTKEFRNNMGMDNTLLSRPR